MGGDREKVIVKIISYHKDFGFILSKMESHRDAI